MIYLDYQATTPLAPEALEAMLPWLGGPGSDGFANPVEPVSRRPRRLGGGRAGARPGRGAAARRRPGLFHLGRDRGAQLGAGLAARDRAGRPRGAARSSITARCSGSRTRARRLIPVGADGLVPPPDEAALPEQRHGRADAGQQRGRHDPAGRRLMPTPRTPKAACCSATRCRAMGGWRFPRGRT